MVEFDQKSEVLNTTQATQVAAAQEARIDETLSYGQKSQVTYLDNDNDAVLAM